METLGNREGEPTRILIVDDEAVIRNAFQIYFETIGYRVSTAQGGDEALDKLKEEGQGRYDVVLLDLVMPGMHGIDVLRRMKDIDHSLEVIIATGCGSMNTAIEAMRHGAFDYITKPVIDLDADLLSVVKSALAHKRNREGVVGLSTSLPGLDRRSPRSPLTDTPEASLAKFYVELEAYTQDMIAAPAQSRKRLAGLASVIEKHLRALAVFLMARSSSDGAALGMRCEEKFGSWSEILDPDRANFPSSSLHNAHARPFVWHRLDLQLSKANDGGPVVPSAVEIMCVPVGRKCPDRSLVIFRRVQGWRSAPSPEGALLALVTELAISPA